MLVLERDGSSAAETIIVCVTTHNAVVVDVPAEMALQEDMIIDRLIDLTFSFLDLSNVEIRVYKSSAADDEPLAADVLA